MRRYFLGGGGGEFTCIVTVMRFHWNGANQIAIIASLARPQRPVIVTKGCTQPQGGGGHRTSVPRGCILSSQRRICSSSTLSQVIPSRALPAIQPPVRGFQPIWRPSIKIQPQAIQGFLKSGSGFRPETNYTDPRPRRATQ